MDLDLGAPVQQLIPHPRIDSCVTQPGPQRCTPARDLTCANTYHVAVYPLAKCCTQLALRVYKTDEDSCAARVNLVDRIWSNQYGAAGSPFIFGIAADQ